MQTMRHILNPDRWSPRHRSAGKAALVALLVLLCMGTAYYGHFVLHADNVYTHLFYVPVVLAGFWWGRRAIWIALLLSGWLLACHGLASPDAWDAAAYSADVFRGAMVIISSAVVGSLREHSLRTSRTLRETREYLNEVIRDSTGPIIAWDTRGKITLFNSALEDLTGFRADQTLGHSLEVLFPDESRDGVLREIDRSLEGESGEAVEIPIVCSDGHVATCLWNSANVYKPDDETPVATVAHGQDITERVRAEKRIWHLNSVLRAIRNVNQLIVTEKDRATLLQKACDALVEARGYEAAWLGFSNDGQGFATVVGSGPGEETSRIAENIMSGDFPQCVRTMLAQEEVLLVFDKRRECGECPFRSAYAGTTTVITRVEHPGRLFGLLAISLGADIAADDEEKGLLREVAGDIAIALHSMALEDARQRAEEEMVESEERYRLLAENSADVIWTMSMDLRLTYVSPSMARLTGYTAEEAMTRTLQESLTPDSAKMAIEAFTEAMALEASGSDDAHRRRIVDLEYIGKDGSTVWTESVVTFLRDLDGRLLGLLGATRDITERKQAEEELRESEERYRAVVDTQTEMIDRFLPDGTVTFANEAYCRNAGKPVEEVVGHSFWPRVPEEDRQWVREHHDSLSPENPTVSYLRRFVKPDGEVRWQEWTVRAIFDQRDEPVEYQNMGQDITERVRAEESLRRRDAILEAVGYAAECFLRSPDWEEQIQEVLDRLGQKQAMAVDSIHVHEVHTDERGVLMAFLLHQWRSPTSPYQGKKAPAPFSLREHGFARWEELLAQGEVIQGRVRDFPPSEREFLAALGLRSIAVLPVFVGEEWWGFVIFSDRMSEREWSIAEMEGFEMAARTMGSAIERSRAVEALRRRDAILEAASYAAECFLRSPDWEDVIAEVTQRLGKAAGVDRVYVRQRNDGPVLTFTSRAAHGWRSPEAVATSEEPRDTTFSLREHGFERWEEALASGNAVWGDAQDYPATEREYMVQVGIKSIAALPIFSGRQWWGFIGFDNLFSRRQWSTAEIDALKTAAGTLGAAIQRQQMEKERARLEAELLQSHKMQAVGQLAGGVAHDFNNILTAIQGYTEFALGTLQENDRARDDLQEVQKASVRAANLTRQLLLFSRRQPILMAPLDLNHLIGDLTKMLDRIIGEDIALSTHLDPHLWTIEGDAGTIEQVIMNLVVNARDAMLQGGEITITSENFQTDEEYCQSCPDARPGDFVRLTVSDTGTGIDPDIIHRIFEPFFTTKKAGKGTGMGLSVVYGIVQQHEGWVTVESSPGKGATFCVCLPAVPMEETEEQRAEIVPATPGGHGERILLVEDEEQLRSFTARALSGHGYVVYPVAGVQKALNLFEQENGDFDLVFADLVLTDGSGLNVARRILEIKPDINVLLTSGYSADKEGWRTIQEEEYPFLQKPYALKDLLRKVDLLLMK